MDEKTSAVTGTRLPQHYGSDPVRFSGHPDALLERHLLFNDLIDPSTAGTRQTFEAASRSVRDVLSRRWALTQRTYHRENPKRIYYLSMEFLIGRSLTNNITNLLLDRYVEAAAREASLDWLGLIEQEPDAGLGNGGLGRLAACFLDSMATMQLPATGMACATSTACSGRRSRTAGSANIRTTGCTIRIRGRWPVPAKPWRSSSVARSRCTGAKWNWLQAAPRR